VFDPFSGRGTTLLESLLLKRHAAAVDINPVAFCVSGAKAQVPRLSLVLRRINVLEHAFHSGDERGVKSKQKYLPPFFRQAFYHTTLTELLYLRSRLNWKGSTVDRFVAALVLGSLHGERDKPRQYFSNQMPRTISTKPNYSLKYWRKHHLQPHKRDVFGIYVTKLFTRLSREVPSTKGLVRMGDARCAGSYFPELSRKVSLVITSPPYFNVTNYEEDQWLRLWFLGYQPHPTYRSISKDDRHVRREKYWKFLQEVWAGMSPLLKSGAIIICRLGAKGIDQKELSKGLRSSVEQAFPGTRLLKKPLVSKFVTRKHALSGQVLRGVYMRWTLFSRLPSPRNRRQSKVMCCAFAIYRSSKAYSTPSR